MKALLVVLANIAVGFLAGLVYWVAEKPEEMRIRESRAAVIARLNSSMPASDWVELMGTLGWSAEGLQQDVIAVEDGKLDTLDADWDWSSSMFFAFTIATSIGYGTFAPKTQFGRIFTIFYAMVSIPLMLSAFTNLTDVMFKALAKRMAGNQHELPVKVFKMIDREGSGTLNKAELVTALEKMGISGFSNEKHTPAMRRRIGAIFKELDRDNTGELELPEFLELLKQIDFDEDDNQAIVDELTRHYVALVAISIFVMFVLSFAAVFVYLKREEEWTFLDAFYFSVITLLTVGIGDLAPNPHPFTYMLAWVFSTFLGLAFTTAMVTSLHDPKISFQEMRRAICPTCLTGARRRARARARQQTWARPWGWITPRQQTHPARTTPSAEPSAAPLPKPITV